MRFKAAKPLAEAPPTDLELTHYQKRVPRRKKKKKKIRFSLVAQNQTSVFQNRGITIKPRVRFFFFDRLHAPYNFAFRKIIKKLHMVAPGWSCGLTRLLDQEGEEAARVRIYVSPVFYLDQIVSLWDKFVRIANIEPTGHCHCAT